MDPRLTPARPDLAAAHLEGQVQAARFVPGTPRRVTAARARLTARPNPAASTTTELLFGEPFTVYEEREGWAWGQAERDGYVGYLSAAALGTPSEATHWLAAPSSHIYPAPDLKQPPLSPLYLGSLLTLAEETPVKGFVKIAEGWVYARHLRPLGQWADDPLAVAHQFVGAPYLWGGRSMSGIDCSGLVQMAVLACGRPAQRDTDMQVKTLGQPVAAAKRQRGDLVYFPGHVGLLVDRDNLLHANATHMAVTVNPLDQVLDIVRHDNPAADMTVKRL